MKHVPRFFAPPHPAYPSRRDFLVAEGISRLESDLVDSADAADGPARATSRLTGEAHVVTSADERWVRAEIVKP